MNGSFLRLNDVGRIRDGYVIRSMSAQTKDYVHHSDGGFAGTQKYFGP